ncbi:hypothetical protein [Paraburkholderia sp. MM6662-R1]|uniref:hypothetical protein n=1 Tax=Paraburkholderia sp. MM6662-R1 TaxID=2991066 RepID=UPI003D22C023
MNKPVVLLKAHVGSYTRKDGAVVAAHDTKVQAATAGTTVTHASLKKHPMYEPSDHAYFKEKGYKPHEIKDIWDRDHALGHKPQAHEKAPDVVGAVTGKPQGKDPAADKPKPKPKPKAKPALDPHPSVIGKAKVKDDHTMEFGGREYWKTGKEGKSMHDGTPVSEYRHLESDHRVWKDDKHRVHADSMEEAKKHRSGK